MRCNGSWLARFHEWKVKRTGALIATVRHGKLTRWRLFTFKQLVSATLQDASTAIRLLPRDNALHTIGGRVPLPRT